MSTMIPFDRALVILIANKMSIVTMLFGRNSQCKYFGVQSLPPFTKMRIVRVIKMVPG